jgi:hypothetical protein
MPTPIRLAIPPAHRELIAELASMPEESAEALKAAFANAAPTDNPQKLSEAVESALTAVTKHDSASVTAMLIAIRSAAESHRLPPAEIANSIATEAQARKVIEQGQREALVRRLEEMLSLRSVVVTAKAFQLSTEYRDKLSSVRVITDLRPIFEDGETDPAATSVMVTHTLKIEMLEQDDVYVAMTNEELLQLKQQVERAVKKAKALDDVIDRGGLKRLDRSESTES